MSETALNWWCILSNMSLRLCRNRRRVGVTNVRPAEMEGGRGNGGSCEGAQQRSSPSLPSQQNRLATLQAPPAFYGSAPGITAPPQCNGGLPHCNYGPSIFNHHGPLVEGPFPSHLWKAVDQHEGRVIPSSHRNSAPPLQQWCCVGWMERDVWAQL